MQPPDQPPPGQPAFSGSDYQGYGTLPLPAPPAAPPYENAIPPYGAYFPAYGQPAAVPQTSGYAIASLICSIGSWFLIPLIGGVLGVIFGHIARREIRRSQGWRSGDGLAIAGLIIGYIHIALATLTVIVVILLAIAFASDAYRY
jgi:uncharacterized protein DUF4190